MSSSSALYSSGLQVLRHLPVDVLRRAEQVCRLWNDVAQDEGIWSQQVSALFLAHSHSDPFLIFWSQYKKLLRSKRLIFPPDDLPHPLVDSAALRVRQLSFSLAISI